MRVAVAATRTRVEVERTGTEATSGSTAPAEVRTFGVRRTMTYLPGLDGVRALAVVAVLAFHGGVPFAQGGFLGVSTFFTLSGFLITSLLLVDARALAGDARPDRRGTVLGFWRRRIRRLMPASLVGILIGLAFALTVGSVEQQRAIPGDSLGALLDVANWRFLLGQQSYAQIFAAPSPLQHYWSLSIEEQFYLVFPLVLIGAVTLFGAASGAARKRFGASARVGVRTPFTIVIAVLLGLSLLSTALHSGEVDRVYYGTDTRAAELLLGCLLAVLLAGGGRVAEVGSSTGRTIARVLGPLALVASVACWWLIDQSDSILASGGFVIYALVSAALVAGATVPGPLSRALSLRPLRWIGAISFGLYVYHWPVFLLLDSERTGLPLYPLLALRVAVTVVIAVASARWLERPIRSGRRPAWLPVRLRIVTPAVVAGILALALIAHQAAPAPTIDFEAAQSQFEDELGSLDLASSAADPAAQAPVTLPKPPMGPVPAPWITVFGDQSAKTMANLLALRQADRGDSVFSDGVYDKGCSLLRGSPVRDANGTHGNVDVCERRAETWPQVRSSTGADVSIVSFGSPDLFEHDVDGSGTWRAVGDPVFDARVAAELDDVITSLTTPDSTILLANIPTDWGILGADRPWTLGAATYQQRAQAMNALIAAAVARHPGVTLLDADGYFASIGGSVVLRPDGATATRAGMAAYGDWVAAQSIEANRVAAQARYDALPNPVAPPGGAPQAPGAARPTRVLVAGDSTAVALAVGLRGHAAVAHDIEVGSVARLNCALAPGGIRRNGWTEQDDQGMCPDDAERVKQAALKFQPDVVIVVDVLWEVTDRKIPGDGTWRTLGDPTYEQFLRERLGRMYDSLTVTGAHLALVQYPHIETGRGDATKPDKPYPANDPARMDRWNAMLGEMAAARPNASVVDLRSWTMTQPGGELDPGFRPDGLHYTTESGRSIADGFLAGEIVRRRAG